MSIIAVIVITLLAGLGGGEKPVAEIPQLTIIGASVDQQTAVDHAVSLFEADGLELPPLIVDYTGSDEICDGRGGLFVPGARVDPTPSPTPAIDTVYICDRHPLYLVHEMAHAWNLHNLTDADRERLTAGWGLERWNDHGDAWGERGTEQAARTIAFTLTLEDPTDDPNILRFACSYELVTGRPLPDPRLVSCD